MGFFYWYGVVSFVLTTLGIGYFLYWTFEDLLRDAYRRYVDYCFLSNIGMNRAQFQPILDKLRYESSDEEREAWIKNNTKWWYYYITFKKMPK